VTTNAFFMALAAGAFAVLCLVAWQLVLALKEIRKTASAVNLFLESTRPRVEAATDRLDSLIARADKILSTAEQGHGVLGTFVSGIGQALAGWNAGGMVVSTISAVLSGFNEAWKAMRKPGEESTAGATGGRES